LQREHSQDADSINNWKVFCPEKFNSNVGGRCTHLLQMSHQIKDADKMHEKAAQCLEHYAAFSITEHCVRPYVAQSVCNTYDFLATSAVFSVSAFLALAVLGVQHLSPLLLAVDFMSLQQALSPCAEATANETEAIATTATNERSDFILNSELKSENRCVIVCQIYCFF
jgi:hypothetical protein